MKRADLEKALREAGQIAKEREFFVLGSQAILGLMPRPPKPCLTSMEVDIYPKRNWQAVRLLVEQLGRRSAFSRRYSYFVDCVSPELATLPDGWMERLVPFRTKNTGGVTGWCLEIHDLVISKLAAGREKDLGYIKALLRQELVNSSTLENTSTNPADKELMRSRLEELLKLGKTTRRKTVRQK